MDKMKEKAKEVSEILKVMGNENRLLILCEVAKGPCSVSELITKLDITQSGISQHLAMMKAYGILEYDKKAQTVYYKIKDERINKIMTVLRDTYCK